MSGRLLTFSQYLGGADNVKVEEMFPSTQKTFTYNYGASVTGYTFEADMQTIVIDTMTYNTNDGQPNFTSSNVLGYFANSEISGSNIITTQASAGLIDFTIPANRYTGPIVPNARENIAITVVAFKWTNGSATPTTTDSHRWAIIERYEPDVSVGNPTLSSTFIPLGVGAISTFSDNASAVGTRTAGTYTGVTGVAAGDSEGTGASWQAVVDGSGDVEFDITTRGTKYITNDTINILDSSLGGGGAADVTITVTATV